MAKRSPIAGYNHNVRYRGLIFHVQTEDSGLQSPHLFTHMFYGGVIISTRKLVYDAGSAEDAIKGLMQSQHKIVLRDLKKGVFDDKIDQYLAGTEGLLPRGSAGEGDEAERPAAATPSSSPPAELPRASEPALQVRMSEPEITLTRPETDHDLAAEMLEPAEQAPAIARASTPPIPMRAQTAPPSARTRTAERKSGPSTIRTSLAPPPPPSMDELDPPTYNEHKDSIAEAFAAVSAAHNDVSGSDVQIRLELEDSDEIAMPRRGHRDTDVAMPHSDGIPGGPMTGGASSRSSGSIPPPIGSERRTGDRINAVGAATLPAARPIARPPTRQAISPPAAMSRPPTNDDARTRGDSDAVEIYAPPPGTADQGERPGQYAQHKRVSQRIPVDVLKNDRGSGSAPIPSGLARPGRPSQSASGGVPQRITREPSTQTHTQPMHTMSRSAAPSPELASRPAERPRTPTPARVSASSSTPSPSRVPSPSSGGVVMTRPAVIVGAPARTTQPKVRKAREEEGRGFGQGLISEKSLDEVILAYLSEDADDK